MALFGGGVEDLNALITKKNYKKAIEVLRGQLAIRKTDPRLRMQLADVLALAGGGREAVTVLLSLADEYAREGFAAKAIAVLKKAEKIDPGRRDIEGKLATLIKQGRSEKPALPLVRPGGAGGAEMEMHEIGIGMAPVSAPAAPSVPDFETEFAGKEISEEAFRSGVLDMIGNVLQSSSPAEAAAQAAAEEAAAIAAGEPTAKAAPVESPLFESFTQDELVEVIHGLQLLTYAPGDIIITEGETGSSLFVLTSGLAKAFVRNQSGKNTMIREMKDGDFFGEVSVIQGTPRTATVTAGTECELLELDRATLDSIAQTKPRVWDVLKDFAALRSGSVRDKRLREST